VPRVARLTWQAGDPAALVAELGRRLGFGTDGAGDRDSMGSLRLALGDQTLDIVPWRREGAHDEPTGDGRLVFEPAWADGDGEHPVGGARPDAGAPLALAGVAWATVDLDRAADELGPWLLPAAGVGNDDAGPADLEEPLLGARARPCPTQALPGAVIVLLEPATEGRLAASLARDGEGPCALYLRPAEGLDAWVAAARRRGVAVSRRRVGPLGPAVLVPGAPVAGPHLVIVDRRERSSLGRGPGTIAP
jgi:hypothetical protein